MANSSINGKDRFPSAVILRAKQLLKLDKMGATVQWLQELSPGYWTLLLLFSLVLGRPQKSLAYLLPLFGRLFGYGTVKLTSADDTIRLRLKSKSGSVTLKELIEPVLGQVRLNPLMFNGHVSSICVGMGKGGHDYKIHYKRKEWESDDAHYPGHFTTDFAIPPPSSPAARDRSLPPRTHNFTDVEWASALAAEASNPLVILSHGFLGGSHEKYIRSAVAALTKAGAGTDFDVVVINSRGCSYSRITTNLLYTPHATWDIRQFVRWARKQWPQRKLFAIGYSIGANVLCNYLGEEGEACELDAAVLVGNPWNLDRTSVLLNATYMGRNLYLRNLGAAFRKTFDRHVEHISKNTAVNVEEARKGTLLGDWERYVICLSLSFSLISIPIFHSLLRHLLIHITAPSNAQPGATLP